MKTTLLVLLMLSGIVTAEDLTGFATYYTVASCQREGTSGVFTASGQRYDESKFTCALRRRDWNSKWKVTNLATGKSVVVTLTDYGPGKGPTAKGVVIDLTPVAFEAIGGKLKDGKMKVHVEKVARTGATEKQNSSDPKKQKVKK
jgi:rare lipoprotein A